MKKILTISIAAYNVEEFIKDTLNSLIVNEVLEYLEIFVVDDESNDNTFLIAKEYEKKYPSSFKVVNKKNGGWGSTLNYTLKNCSGKYIKILDGDDLFDAKGLVQLVEFLIKSSADVVYTPYIIFDNQSKKESLKTTNVSKNELINMSYINNYDDLVMHSCAILTSIIKNNNIFVLENCFYTDNEFITKVLACAKDIYFLQSPVYKYRVGLAGQSVSYEGMKKHYADRKKVIDELFNFYEIGTFTNKKVIENNLKRTILNHYRTLMLLNKKKELRLFDAYLKCTKEQFYYVEDKKITFFRKINFNYLSIFSSVQYLKVIIKRIVAYL